MTHYFLSAGGRTKVSLDEDLAALSRELYRAAVWVSDVDHAEVRLTGPPDAGLSDARLRWAGRVAAACRGFDLSGGTIELRLWRRAP